MRKWFDKYPGEIVGAIIGFLVATCFLSVGFFRTIFIIVVVVLGVVCGRYWPRIQKLFTK